MPAIQDWVQTEFSAADLHLVGDMCSSPLTRAIRNDVLAARAPSWSDDSRKSLANLGEKLLDDITFAIRKNKLPFARTPDWYLGTRAMDRAFGLGRDLHLFGTEDSIRWTSFTEPQFTRGIAYFLDASNPMVRVERVRALLKALGAPELAKDLNGIKVSAEAEISRGRRIDLLLEWKDSENNRFAVAIEAKLGHHVTRGQLSAYREHLKKIAGEDRRRLVIVSPWRSRKTDRSLRRNLEWYWISWHDLLVAHERCLSDNFDSGAYRQFRRTLWDQTG